MVSLTSSIEGHRSESSTGLPSASSPMGVGGEVDVHRAGQRVGHHERRRGQVVHPHVGVDASLEVPVAREHRRPPRGRLLDGVGHAVEQRAGVADAGGAAVADEVEAELLQRLGQAGPLEVVHDDPRAGRQRGLDPGLGAQAPLDRLLGQQPGADHDLRVRRVGAAGDGGDDDVAVGHLVVRCRRGLGGGRARARSSATRKASPATPSATRSWGRAGPASEGSTSPRSRLTYSE